MSFGTGNSTMFGSPSGTFSASGDGDEDDLYGGFNYSIDMPSLAGGSLGGVGSMAPSGGFGAGFGVLGGGGGGGGSMFGGSNFGAPPSTALRGAPPGTSMNRMMTGRLMTGAAGGDAARPMTSVKGAGFSTDAGKANRASFDPLNQGTLRGPAPPLSDKGENSPEDAAKDMEKIVHKFLEESATAAAEKNFQKTLERAKEAVKKERMLCKHRESNGLVEQINLDLTYAVCFNLANSYYANGMFPEALSTYSLIVKNKQYPQSGRLRVNMGNIYFEQKKYPMAVKMYRMALDQIPNTIKETRHKISRNIGSCLVRMGRFQEAIGTYENIMESAPDLQTGFNLVVCYFALGDGEKMKKGFSKLVSVPIEGVIDEEDPIEESKETEGISHTPPDSLREEIRNRQTKASHYIITAATLIAPVLDQDDWVIGYDWIIETLSHEHTSIANEMEISKANMYLKHKNFSEAVDVLKRFEKKDQALKARAATNLSFLYFLEGEINLADKYANLAVKNDRYNAKALVNKGNCFFVKGELERAKELFLEAIGVEADCVEAIYNLGLVNKEMGILSESLQAFEKLHSVIPNAPEVIYQIANLHDIMGSLRNATKWFNILITRVPSDPEALARLGQIFNKDEDETQAFHYHLESYQYLPINLEVVSWLGVWYVKSGLFEKAIHFFKRATEIQPREVKWRLMVTSCYRRMGNYQKALELYKEIHKQHPENLECLRYLVAICKDLGLKFDTYQVSLMKLERQNNQMTRMAPGATFAAFGADDVGNRGGPGNMESGRAENTSKSRMNPSSAIREAPSDNVYTSEAAPRAGTMGAPSVTGNIGGNKRGGAPPATKKSVDDDDDDFADADLDDLLAD